MRGEITEKVKFLTVFEQKDANVKATSEARKITRATFYNWAKNTDLKFAILDGQPEQTFKAHVEDIREGLLDKSEQGLHDCIGDKNITAIIFHLKTKGKHRGYVERTETVDKTSLVDRLKELDDAEVKEKIDVLYKKVVDAIK